MESSRYLRFPSTPSAPSSNGMSPQPVKVVQRTHTTNHPATAALAKKELVNVQVHFNGPIAKYLHGGGAPYLTPDEAWRIEGSLAAHRRRFKVHGQHPALSAPSIDGMEIDMCYVDFSVDINAPKRSFMKTLRDLEPNEASDARRYVLRYEIVCPSCGDAVVHSYADKKWNGWYLDHRKECASRLRMQDMEWFAAQREASTRRL